MFKHILVPLDGSVLAEAALPPAGFLACVLSARVTLLHVIEEDAPATIHGERHLRTTGEAETYLRNAGKLAALSGCPVDYHVHDAATRDVVRSIVAHEGEFAPDLIVLSTHGRGGLRRILAGSIAQQVAASGSIPVLLIRPDGADMSSLQSLLAPLDGKEEHQQGLEVALGLASAAGAALRLLSIAPTQGALSGHDVAMARLMPGTTQAMLELAESELKSYLARQLERVRSTGVPVSAEIRTGSAATIIADYAEEQDAGMIVLATHGRAGNEAFWAGSVAAKVQARTRRPLLLVPVKPTKAG